MGEGWDTVTGFFAGELFISLVRATIILVVGWLLARLAGRHLPRLFGSHLDAQRAMLVRRLTFHLILVLVVLSVLRELGFDLTVLLGAAGVLTLAIGFASQTSASNLVSGLFLIGERPFAIGEFIRVGETTGEVVSIDLLSVKLRTFDNLMVRVPNESLIKSAITNLSRYPIRRLDVALGVAYKEDVEHVRRVLNDVAAANPLCLEEPPPLFLFLGFGDSGLDLQFSVWAARENFLTLRNTIHEEIKNAFDAAGIEIPFPHRSLYAGEATRPFPVAIVEPNMPEESPT